MRDITIEINPAVKLKGRYRLGQWQNPQAPWYYSWDAVGTDNALSEGQWTMFWATVQLPWGTLEVGKRRFIFGAALQYDGSDSLTTESVLLKAPYGPLEFGVGFYPHWPARRGQIVTIDPYDLIAPENFNHADKTGGDPERHVRISEALERAGSGWDALFVRRLSYQS